ncbi:MAG: hypothetical protein JXA42_14780 [Anaerolineales bacterium]|nr:hypothetical protein [Anaerolineales bacterium]
MMRQTLKNDGFEQIFDEYILPATGNILYSKALNRSVTGSMNEFVYYAINRLIDGGLAPNAVSSILNETFMSYIDYKYPKEAFRSLSFQEIGVITGENVDDG